NKAHFSKRPTERSGNQSSHQPSPACRPGRRGVRRGCATKRKKSRSSSGTRGPTERRPRRSGLLATIAVVQWVCGLSKLASQQGGSDSPAAIDHRFDLPELIAPRRIQYEGCHLLCQTKCARMAYTQAQAPECRTREGRLNIAQAVMAGMTATLLQLYLTRLQVEFVMEDEDFFRCELVKPHERPCGLART